MSATQRRAYHSLGALLAGLSKAGNTGANELHTANGLWAQKGFAVQPASENTRVKPTSPHTETSSARVLELRDAGIGIAFDVLLPKTITGLSV